MQNRGLSEAILRRVLASDGFRVPGRVSLPAFPWTRTRRVARIEHVNLTVKDPEATARLLAALFGWQVRWRGTAIHGGHSLHVGDASDYLALYSGRPDRAQAAAGDSYATTGGLNHIGVVVDDLDATEARVKDAGYVPVNHADYEPGRRFYFREENGIEIEVVSYA